PARTTGRDAPRLKHPSRHVTSRLVAGLLYARKETHGRPRNHCLDPARLRPMHINKAVPRKAQPALRRAQPHRPPRTSRTIPRRRTHNRTHRHHTPRHLGRISIRKAPPTHQGAPVNLTIRRESHSWII